MADRTVVYRLRAELGQFKAQMAQAGASAKKAAGDLTSMDKSAVRTRQGLDTLGGAAGKVGLVAAAGLGAAVVASANFDKAMSEVQAATHETTSNMELLRQAALDAGQATAFSATEAAAGIEELSKAGVSTSDILGGGLTGALDLAAAGGIEVAEAAETAASAMTQFGISGQQVPHIADLLAAAAGKAQGSVSDMGAALNQSGLVASQTGLTIEETTGTLAAFASAGLTGSDAGTSFKTMLQSLTPTSAKARELMDELGISAYDAQGNFVGMTEFAGSLQAGLADLSVEQQNAAMKTIFGSDAVRAASVVFEQGADGIQDWIANVDDAGYAAETAATRMDNLAGDWEAFTGSLETALIGTGDGAQGPLRSLVQGATDAVNAYNKLPASIQGATAAALGLTAVLGGGLWFGSKVIQGVANTREALGQLGIEAGKSGRAVATIGKGLEFAILVQGITMLDEAFAKLLNTTLEGDLSRNLDALATNGELLGGLDLIGSKLRTLSSTGMSVQNTVFGWLPGSTAFESAAEDVGKVDEALASMVESGREDDAAAIFETLQTEAAALGVSADDVAGSFDQYQLALRNAKGATGLLTPATEGLREVASGLGSTVKQVATQVERQSKALQEARKAARETSEAFVGIENAVGGAKQSLNGFLRNLEDQAAALRDFRENAEKAGKRGLREGLIADLQELGPEGARTMRQLANATDAEIKRANKAWQAGQREADRYTDAVGGAKDAGPVTTDVNVNAGQAFNILDLVRQQMRYLDGLTSTTYVDTVRRNRVSGGDQEYATGGYVSGPGTATSDSIPALLSNGEFVMKAAAVDRYGPEFMHQINAMRFAEGGLAQRHALPVGSGSPVVHVAGSSLAGARFVLEVPGMGQMVTRVVDTRLDDHDRHRTTRTLTHYGEVEDLG